VAVIFFSFLGRTVAKVVVLKGWGREVAKRGMGSWLWYERHISFWQDMSLLSYTFTWLSSCMPSTIKSTFARLWKREGGTENGNLNISSQSGIAAKKG